MPDLTLFDEFDEDKAQQAREHVRLESVHLEPYPDGRRVKLHMQITPFGPDSRPNLKITIRNARAEEMASMDVVEWMTQKVELTVHLRGEMTPDESYLAQIDLYYDPARIQHSVTESFTLPHVTNSE